MQPSSKLFTYCPKCRQDAIRMPSAKESVCDACGFTFFQNTAAAAGLILECNGQLLFTVRDREPAKGLLGLPGGFIDNGESAEDGLRREMREELDLTVPTLTYLGSYPNRYLFREVLYHTLDLYFYARLASVPAMEIRDEIAAIRWLARADFDPGLLAFDSARLALPRYLALPV